MPSPSWFLPERKAKVLVKLAEELVERHKEGKRVLCRMAAKCVGKLVSASRAVPVSKLYFERSMHAFMEGSSHSGGARLLCRRQQWQTWFGSLIVLSDGMDSVPRYGYYPWLRLSTVL